MKSQAPIVCALGVVAALRLLLDPAAALAAGKPSVRDPSPCEAACELGRFIDLNIGLTHRPLTLDQLRRFQKLESDTPTPSEGGATLHELSYPGLDLRVYAPTSGAAIIDAITVTGDAYKLPFGLQLDSEPGVIEDLFGPPHETDSAPPDRVRWIYRNLEGTAAVTFEIEKDTAIKSVEWDFASALRRPARKKPQ